MPHGDERCNPQATAEVAVPPSDDGPRAGDLLGQYRLLERIGAGGMGQVFKAMHPTMQRTVAIKIMAPTLMLDARARARFLREVRSTARLIHPNIVLAYDAAEEGGRCFLVMEYVEGRDAAVLLEEHGLPPISVACAIVRQAALGLQHAHETGMVHRDIKPGNLVIAVRRPPTPPGTPGAGPLRGWPADPLVKVLDFGLARFQASETVPAVHVPGSTPLTREGHVVGTPEFMAPEQACNSPSSDIRADIYGLGCTFYCLLTGRPPFSGPSLLETMVQHLQAPLPPVNRTRRDVPPGVLAVLERMLAKRPEERYQQPGEVAEALLPWVSGPCAGAAEAVVAGQPINVYPETEASAPLAGRTAALPAVQAPTAAFAPPAARAQGTGATSRSSVGCLALSLVLIASMIAGFFLLPRLDRGKAEDPASDNPRPGPLPGMMLARFPHGRLEPSYGPPNAVVEVPRDFEMSVTEVTREQFRAFVRGATYVTAAESGTGGQRGALVVSPDGKGAWSEAAAWDTWRADLPGDTPVVCVTWEDAVRFCNWLSTHEHLDRCYELHGGPAGWECHFEANGYRLPTEAEWEYAARAGERAAVPAPSDLLLQQGWFLENAAGQPHAVGGKEKNSRGLCDVWGNAWEWCWDHHATTLTKTTLRPTGPETGAHRVVRGGGWCDPAPISAAKTRGGWSPDHRSTDVGFRLARTLPGR